MIRQNEYKKIKDKTVTEYDKVTNRGLVLTHMRSDGVLKRQDISLEMNRRMIESIEGLIKNHLKKQIN
jgi:hypothetical protein|tara:strand:- start:8308 stop:8511 length:204 start_codon:yes stop_codon:yes gene_type:complete